MRQEVHRQAMIRKSYLHSQNNEAVLKLLGRNNDAELISSIYAAELFPDRTIPELLIALDELEDHDDLRKRYQLTHPQSEPRISGNIVDVQGLQLFTIDPVVVEIGIFTLPTKKGLPEVIEILLDMGYIPVDPAYRLITPEMTTNRS